MISCFPGWTTELEMGTELEHFGRPEKKQSNIAGPNRRSKISLESRFESLQIVPLEKSVVQ